MTGKKIERAKRATAQALRFTHDVRLSPTSRALPLYFNDPGVPLRSTPGFMLSPRFAGYMQKLFTNLIRVSFSLSMGRRRLIERLNDKLKFVGHLSAAADDSCRALVL